MTIAPGPLTIRKAKHWDGLILSKLAMDSYVETFGHTMTKEELRWQLQNTKSLRYFDERIAIDVILLAILEGRMVGYAQVTDVTLPVASAGPADRQLNALYVGREFHRRGIGSRLMDRVLTLPHVKSAPNLYLDVWNENKQALGFYRYYGFEVIGETDVAVNSKVIGKDLIMRLSPADVPRTKTRRPA